MRRKPGKDEQSNGMAEPPYRVRVDKAHFRLVRHYMVDRDLRSVGKALEEMIERVAATSTNEQIRQEGALLRSKGE